jgi:hypothetical protein
MLLELPTISCDCCSFSNHLPDCPPRIGKKTNSSKPSDDPFFALPFETAETKSHKLILNSCTCMELRLQKLVLVATSHLPHSYLFLHANDEDYSHGHKT